MDRFEAYETVKEYSVYLKKGHTPNANKWRFEKALELIKEFALDGCFSVDINAHRWANRLTVVATLVEEKETKEAIPEEKEGVYLIGCTAFNPYTDEHIYYLKVGRANSVCRRLTKDYPTCCPSLWKIDNFYTNESKFVERFFQHELSEKAIQQAKDSKEWYQVSRETYLNFSQNGFNAFEKKKYLKDAIDLIKQI